MRAKRFISVILSLLIVCSSFAGLTAFADETNENERTKDVASVGADVSDKYSVATSDEAVQDQSGTTGDCTWSFDEETNTLTISGNGKMGDYNWSSDMPWYDFDYDIKNVVIENGVTSIGRGAFSGCRNLTGVTIPDSVTNIGEEAFNDTAYYKNQPNGVVYIDTWVVDYKGDMPENTNIELRDGTKGIADKSFESCTNLSSITIPDSVTSIGLYGFLDCTGLSSITIPDSVKNIEDCVFSGCTSLASVKISSSIKSIGFGMFFCCTSLTSVTIPNSVTSIGGSAFYSCTSLTSVTIPNSVTSIGSYAFYGCTSLTNISIPDSVTSISGEAFYNSGFYNNQPDGVVYIDDWVVDYKGDMPKNTSIELRDGTIGIADSAFENCRNLTSITISQCVISIGNSAFKGCTSLIGLTIPNSITEIGSSAFFDCSGLTEITIPDRITSIKKGVFSGCKSLSSVTIGDSVKSIGENAFNGCKSLTNVTIPDSVTDIGNSAFAYCSGLTEIKIPESVTYIDRFTFFYCTSLTSVIIGDSVTSIGESAFENCKILTSVTIGDSVKSIGENAFNGCTSLTGVYVTNIANWCEIDFPNNTSNPLYYAKKLFINSKLVTELIIPDSVTSIGDYTFYGCSSLTSVTISDSVKSIGEYSFSCCTSLDGITIGDSVTSIGKWSFFYCSSLTSVTIPDSVTSIGYRSFENCASLSNVKIGKGITSIGDWMFYYCPSLTSVTIPDSVTSIGSGAFSDCTGLTSVTIPNSVTSIGEYAFSGCTGLASITIGDSVTSLGNGSFSDCSSLTSVTIPDSVTIIGYRSFENCASLVSATIGNGVSIIGNRSFLDCLSLTSITIPESVTGIGWDAFGYYFDEENNYQKIENFTIYGYEGASAEKYAKDNEFDFISLGIAKIEQDITGFEPKHNVTFGDNPFNLNAKAETALTYASNNTSVAEVSADGTVTIKGVGTATITITAEETDYYKLATATVEITVNKSSQEITGFEPKYDVTYGDKPFNLNAKAETALSYVSDNTSVAEVSSDGIVTIKGAGKATITITAEETASYKSATTSVEITVNKASQEVSVDKLDYKLTYGAKSFNLNAKAETELSYISDNTSVADVSADGTVTIKGAGTATITITAEGTANYIFTTATVEITVNKSSQEVSIDKQDYKLTYGAKPFNLNAKAETALSYASDNTSVAEVSEDGIVTIKGAGKATITITAEETEDYNSATATVEITVNKSGQEVSVAKQEYKLTYSAKPFSLNAKAETALTYASSNPKVAYVSADGTVTIKGAGTATITITAEEAGNYTSVTATVKITVAKATQKVTGVKTQYVTSAGKSFTLKPKAKTKLTYTSSNKNVAVVSSTGKVTVKAGGYAYITVKANENGNYKSSYVKTKIISAPRDFTSKDISKVKKTGTTKAKITWKSLAGATGYTVQLATNKTYKGAKTVKNSKNAATLTGLKKGKTYYVRINAYTKVSGKNYSNKWYTVKFKM